MNSQAHRSTVDQGILNAKGAGSNPAAPATTQDTMTMAEHTPTQGPWRVREWSMDRGTQESSGSIYAEPHEGHAYAVAMCPRYQTQERWNADAALIVHAKNSLHANEAKIASLVKALHEAIARLEDVADDTGYQLDGDFTKPEDKLLARLRAALPSEQDQ